MTPAGSRRVHAGQKRCLDREENNTANKLRKRELGLRPSSCFQRRSSTERFRNFAMQVLRASNSGPPLLPPCDMSFCLLRF